MTSMQQAENGKTCVFPFSLGLDDNLDIGLLVP